MFQVAPALGLVPSLLHPQAWLAVGAAGASLQVVSLSPVGFPAPPSSERPTSCTQCPLAPIGVVSLCQVGPEQFPPDCPITSLGETRTHLKDWLRRVGESFPIMSRAAPGPWPVRSKCTVLLLASCTCAVPLSLSVGAHTRPDSPCRVLSLEMPLSPRYTRKPPCPVPAYKKEGQGGLCGQTAGASLSSPGAGASGMQGLCGLEGQRGRCTEPMAQGGPCRNLCQSGHETPSKT